MNSAALDAFRTLFPTAQTPDEALPVAGHDVFVLDVDNPNSVHLAQYCADTPSFDSDGSGWFDHDEIALWCYAPNAEQAHQRRLLGVSK